MRIFVSHSHKDKAFVEPLSLDISQGVESIWYSEWSLQPGDSLVQKINEGLHTSSIFIVVLSKNSVDSKWVRKELSEAINLQLQEKIKRIIPIKIDDVDIHAAMPLLGDLLYIDFHENYDLGLKKLLSALDARISRNGILRLRSSDKFHVGSISVWDVMGWEATDFDLTWTVDQWNRVAEFYVSPYEFPVLKIQLTKREWLLLRGLRSTDRWITREFVREGAEFEEASSRLRKYHSMVKAQYISRTGLPAIVAWAISDDRAQHIENVRVMLFGE